MKRWMLSVLVVLAAAWGLAPRRATADCGSVPFYAPLVSGVEVVTADHQPDELKFDPLKVSVFEPRQRAIILWNGEEETLLLSTDQRASRRSAVLEVIPMPAQPEVSLGQFKTFEVAQSLLIEKSMWATAHPGVSAELVKAPAQSARITFQNRLGAHDLTVAEVLDTARFTQFVQAYLAERYKTSEAPIRPEFIKIIQSYLDAGFRWFAFDVITLDTSNASRQPIQYRFKSDKVFYPLRISSLEVGKTEADLLIFTAGEPTRFTGIDKSRIDRTEPVSLTQQEFATMEKTWAGFFIKSPAIRMSHWTIKGRSAELLKDVQAQ